MRGTRRKQGTKENKGMGGGGATERTKGKKGGRRWREEREGGAEAKE